MKIIKLTLLVGGFVLGSCHRFDNSWFIREYQNAEPHDKAVIEQNDRVLEIECESTTYANGHETSTCGWLEQHVGHHLQNGNGFQQISRAGNYVCYHDNIGGRECFIVVREHAIYH